VKVRGQLVDRFDAPRRENLQVRTETSATGHISVEKVALSCAAISSQGKGEFVGCLNLEFCSHIDVEYRIWNTADYC